MFRFISFHRMISTYDIFFFMNADFVSVEEDWVKTYMPEIFISLFFLFAVYIPYVLSK